MLQWSVAYTQPQKEQIALQNLNQQGFDSYCPCFLKKRRHARKIDMVQTPLFPRYIFVALDLEIHAWRAVNGTRGVQHLICQDNKPKIISETIIQELRKRENSEGVVPIEALALFTKGDLVEVKSGAFAGQIAQFEKFSDKDRVMILIEFLGRPVQMLVKTYDIKRLNP